MSILFNKTADEERDNNGGEAVQAATNPNWFSGTGSEIQRGAANVGKYFQRTVLQADDTAATALGVNQHLGQDGTVHKIYDIAPTPDAQLPKYTAPDALHNGAVAIGLGSFVQQSPALLAAIFGGIGAGAAMSAGMSADQARDEGLKMGLTGDALTQYTATQATVGLITGGLPGVAGVGRGLALYGSRFVAGGAVNVAADYTGSWARGAVLDAHGYHAQAQQAREYDAMSAAGSFFMGGLFNMAGHGGKRPDAAPGTEAPPAGAPAAQAAPVESVNLGEATAPQPAAVDTSGTRLSRGDVKVVKSELANTQRHIDRLTAMRNDIANTPVKGSGKVLSQARAARSEQLRQIDSQLQATTARNAAAVDSLNSHLSTTISRADTITRDAATSHMLNDNMVTESAPGLATTPEAEAAHMGAMNDATEALNAGRKVDVSAHAQGHEFLVTADEAARQQEVRNIFTADDATLSNIDSTRTAAETQPIPGEKPSSKAPDNQIDEVSQLRQQADALAETHPEVAAQMHDQLNNIESEYNTAVNESSLYQLAATCALNYGA